MPPLRARATNANEVQRPSGRLILCSSLIRARINTPTPPTDSAIIIVISDIDPLPGELGLRQRHHTASRLVDSVPRRKKC